MRRVELGNRPVERILYVELFLFRKVRTYSRLGCHGQKHRRISLNTSRIRLPPE